MSDGRLTLLAVDDERPQLEDLARLLRGSPSVREVECASDGRDALAKASRQPYDAIFLDVRMPGLDGVELARVLRRFAHPPQLVFVSAHDGAAVEAFELHAIDYLRKPVARGRVAEAIERILTAVDHLAGPANPAEAGGGPAGNTVPAGALGEDTIAVATLHGDSTRLLARNAIEFVQSYGDFVRIVTADGRYLLRTTMTDLERRWEPFGFVRVHRQYLANLRTARELRPQLGGTAELIFADGQSIPVARRHAAALGRRLSP